MSVDGEMFTQVSPATEALSGRIARRKVRQPRPLMKPQVLCTPCRNMIGAFVANEPHVGLTNCVFDVPVRDDLEYYGCRVCSTRLVRDKKSHDFGVRWRLI
jgi:hypothetical protein